MKDQVWLEEINRTVQQLLAQSSLGDREVELRGRPDLSLEIVVDGEVYQDVDEIPDAAIRDLIRTATEEWQNEAVVVTLVQALQPARHPASFRSRAWLIAWLLAMILVFVLPPMFITPAHVAARFSLSWTGGMLGGLIGALAGRAIARRVAGDENVKVQIFWGVLGGGLSVPLGYVVAVGILSVIP